MKKLLIAMLSMVFSTQAFSQVNAGEFSVSESSVYYGVRLGGNISSVSGDHSPYGSRLGLTIGGVIGLRVSDSTPLFVESGLYYTQMGAEKNKEEVNLNYLEIPALIKAGFELDNDIAILPFVGPVFGVGIAGKIKGYDENKEFHSESSFGKDKYLRPDVGLKLGCGAEWNMIYVELGYRFGIANIWDSEEFSQHNNAFFMNLGVNF
jgi:hypothetical protein